MLKTLSLLVLPLTPELKIRLFAPNLKYYLLNYIEYSYIEVYILPLIFDVVTNYLGGGADKSCLM